MEHKFQIKGIRLNESHFSLIRDFHWKPNEPIEIKHSVEVGYTINNTDLHVTVSISAISENQPFRVSVSWEGIFVFQQLPSKENFDRIAHINCASIIFPFVRESIADLTQRAGIPPFHLPPFNFVALYEEKQKSEAGKPARKPRRGSKTQKNVKQ